MISRTPTLAILILGLAACASPRYQSVYRYEAPTDASGGACLQVCARKMAECREQCTTKTLACLKSLEPLVEERYDAALKQYEMELERYRHELLHYDLQLSLNWGRPYPWRHGLWPYSWAMPYYFPPATPVKPSRNAEFERLRHELCDVDCGCQPVYDTCFIACGGKKIPEVQCISDCPK